MKKDKKDEDLIKAIIRAMKEADKKNREMEERRRKLSIHSKSEPVVMVH